MIDTILTALDIVVNPLTLFLIASGVSIGIVFGAIPGLGSVLGMSILLPLTIVLNPAPALIFLVSIYSGAMYGSSIASILINIPGTPSAAATTFDGYPMTEQGKGVEALALSVTASVLGGSLTMILLLFLVPFLTPIVLAFSAPQIFLVALFGIVLIGIISSTDSTWKGVLSGLFGILIMTIGVAPGRAQARYTFDIIELFNGINFVAILIGMFAIGEVLRLTDTDDDRISDEEVEVSKNITKASVEGVKETLSHSFTVLKSSAIGMTVGMIPGMGGSSANFFSYTEAVRSSKDAESFGNGNPIGVIAAEASNNAVVAGSLVPVLSFGIPGSASTAVLLGGFVMHGINPGPEMFTTNINITYSMIVALILGNAIIFVIGLILVNRLGERIVKTHIDLLIPIIVLLSVVGAYGLRANWIDIIAVFVFGIIAYYMIKYNYSIIAFVIGAVLSPILESNFQRSLRLSEGSYAIFINDPLSIVIILVLLIFMLVSFVIPQLKGGTKVA